MSESERATASAVSGDMAESRGRAPDNRVARPWPGLDRASAERSAVWLAALVLAVAVIGGLTTLAREPWLDEFFTLVVADRARTPAEFLSAMTGEVHPLLHYGLVYIAQSLGLTGLVALRALNLAGVALVAWALWLARRRDALTVPQACVAAALYASSAFFLDHLGELRAYFLLHSASVALALVWRVLARDAAQGRAWGAGALSAWLACLAVFVNLHYFATLLGGLLTPALILAARGRGVIPLALGGLLAAAPAVALALVQTSGADAGLVNWIATGRIDAAFVIVDAVWAAAAFNLVAAGCAVAAALFAVEARGIRPAATWTDEIVLAATLCAYFALLLAVNLVRPIVIDRYLIAASGPVVVGVALLAGGRSAPAWGAAAACAFALAVQARGLYARTFPNEGWSASASLVADLARKCESARIFIDPAASSPQTPMLTASRRYGLELYAARYGLSVSEIGPGESLPPPERCPNVVWLEHYGVGDAATAEEALAALSLTAPGRAELFRVGSGVVIVVR